MMDQTVIQPGVCHPRALRQKAHQPTNCHRIHSQFYAEKFRIEEAHSERSRLSYHATCLCYRVSSQIQFVSHVFPPSGEKDCSIRADFGEMFNQMYRTKIERPLYCS